jgi:hypothetical protein
MKRLFYSRSFLEALLILLALASAASADQIVRVNGEVMDSVTVTRITDSEVQYTVSDRQVLSRIPSASVSEVVYADGERHSFGMQVELDPEAGNFSGTQRFGAWALNAFTISGLGSWAVMGDATGGFIHLGLSVSGFMCILLGGENKTLNDTREGFFTTLQTTGALIFLAGGIYNIVRTLNYDKPVLQQSIKSTPQSGISFMVLPSNEGAPSAALFYARAF